jgi:hypothetical protein
MVAGNRGLYYLVAQYLNLGIGDIEPGSVRWNGQHFTGSTTSGELRTGELEISNQIPTRLTIRNKYDEVVKAVEYSYPENWRENSGFPKRMVIMKTTSAGLQPHFEIIIEKITLARHKLTSASFAVTNFLTTNMAHVEIYFNQTLYAMDKNGHMRRVYGPIEKFQLNRGQTTSRKGFVIGALILIVITPVLLWLIPKMFKLKGAGS